VTFLQQAQKQKNAKTGVIRDNSLLFWATLYRPYNMTGATTDDIEKKKHKKASNQSRIDERRC